MVFGQFVHYYLQLAISSIKNYPESIKLSIKLLFVVYSLYTNCNLNRHLVLRRFNRCFPEVLIFLVWSSSSSHVTESSRCYCDRHIFLATHTLSLISEYFHSLITCHTFLPLTLSTLTHCTSFYSSAFSISRNPSILLYGPIKYSCHFLPFVWDLRPLPSPYAASSCTSYYSFQSYLANLFPCLHSISYSSYSFHLQDIPNPSFKMTPTPVCFSDLLL